MAGLAAAFGSGAMTNSIAEIADTDCLLVVGSNTTEAHPMIARRMFKAKDNGAKLIVVDPRKIQLTRLADIHLQLNFGTDIALINGLMHVILKNDWHNLTFIADRTENFEELKPILDFYTLEKTSEITGIPEDLIMEAARIYATSKNASICYTLGITEHAHGVDNVKSLANLTMITGHLGKESSGLNPLRGQNNVQGACDMGALPNVFSGYQSVGNDIIRKKFETAWGTSLPGKIGLTIPEIMDGLIEGSMKGLYIFGENSVKGDPNTEHVKKALKAAEFLVVHDIFLTATAMMADLVLPGACFAEVDGTFTNTERRVQRIRKAVEPPGDAMPNWKIFSEIGSRLGIEMNYDSAEAIFDEMTSLTPSFSGLSYERIDHIGLQWPCPSPEHPGTRFLHRGMFTRGKGHFHAIRHRPSAEQPDGQYPFVLTTGRRYAHYNTSTMTGRSKSLNKEFPGPMAKINTADARQMNIVDGGSVKVISRRGEIITPVQISQVVPRGSIFMDFHFPCANSNALLGTFLDPLSKTPDYKVCAVKLEKFLNEKGNGMFQPKTLIIDDEDVICKACKMILSEQEYSCDYCLSGSEGLERVLNQHYDMLLLDIKLKDMNGLEILRRVRNEKPDLHVIIITGYSTITNNVMAMELGANDYLSKPFADHELIKAANDLFNQDQSYQDQ